LWCAEQDSFSINHPPNNHHANHARHRVSRC
jgi:hypothetical protein